MKNGLKLVLVSVLLLFPAFINAQVENVELGHGVYDFLKEMKVKNIIGSIHDDLPNMSYGEVKKYLKEIDKKKEQLSPTEIDILNKYEAEFFEDEFSAGNTAQLFNPENSFLGNLSELASDKERFLYYFSNDYVNFHLNAAAHIIYSQQFKPVAANTEFFDLGFRARGTMLDHLGYSFSFTKGGIAGARGLAATVDPRLNYNFKFVENIENISNYDYTEGYLRYALEPADNMLIAAELGREKIKIGFGYGNSLAISGEGPLMDLLRFDFRYGVLSLTSIHASTVGEYDPVRSDQYTKYIASNIIKLSLPSLFDLSIGESIVYSGRGLEWAYINPFLFYKYAEMSLQDRDNGTVYLGFQSHFIKDFEIQGTFFLDEDILSNLQDLQLFSNKTGYQLGFFWYEPLQISDLSIVCEYTRIRPYVYTHDNYKNTFTAFGAILGHRIGPNSDEILARATYNLTDRIRLNAEYRHTRSGKNIYDSNGNLVKNVGGNVFQPYRYNVDDTHPAFLDGIRYDYDFITAGIRYEPWRKIFLDFNYTYDGARNRTAGGENDLSYLVLKLTMEY